MFVYMLFGLGFTMVFPFAFRRLFDNAIPSGQFSQVLQLLVVLAVAFVVSLLADLRRRVPLRLRQRVGRAPAPHARCSTSSRTFPRAGSREHQEGDVMSRLFSDVYMLEARPVADAARGLFQILSLVVSSVVLLTLNPLLGAIVLVGRADHRASSTEAMAEGRAEAQHRGAGADRQRSTASRPRTTAPSRSSGPSALEARESGRASGSASRAAVRRRGALAALRRPLRAVGEHDRDRAAARRARARLVAHPARASHRRRAGRVHEPDGRGAQPGHVAHRLGQQIQSSTGALVRINEVLDAEPEIADARPAPTVARRCSREIRFDHVGFSYTPGAPDARRRQRGDPGRRHGRVRRSDRARASRRCCS